MHITQHSKSKINGNNIVNETNWRTFYSYYISSTSTSFGPLQARHQDEQLCLCSTQYLLFCIDDCLVCSQLYLCGTWYLLFCIDDCLVCSQLYLCGTWYLLFCIGDCLVCSQLCLCNTCHLLLCIADCLVRSQLCLCDTCHLLLCIADCLVCSHLYRITSAKCHINTVVPPDGGPGEVQNM